MEYQINLREFLYAESEVPDSLPTWISFEYFVLEQAQDNLCLNISLDSEAGKVLIFRQILDTCIMERM